MFVAHNELLATFIYVVKKAEMNTFGLGAHNQVSLDYKQFVIADLICLHIVDFGLVVGFDIRTLSVKHLLQQM